MSFLPRVPRDRGNGQDLQFDAFQHAGPKHVDLVKRFDLGVLLVPLYLFMLTEIEVFTGKICVSLREFRLSAPAVWGFDDGRGDHVFFATGDNSAQYPGIENLIWRHHCAGGELFICNILRDGRLSKNGIANKEKFGVPPTYLIF